MAYDNNQQEPGLPTGNDAGRKTQNHLPRYFRTPFNTKFLSSTLDQLTQPGVAEKLNGFIGSKIAKAYTANDVYISDVSSARENYQLEPASVIKDTLGNVTFYKDYNDYINSIANLGGDVSDHSLLNSQEYYAWNPLINWDMLSNFREYYWLPDGPDLVRVFGQSKEVESTYTVELGSNDNNVTYIFNPDGLTNNPTIKLYRGQRYRFEIDTPNQPMAFATKKSFTPGESVIVETSDGIRSPGVFDATLYDQDGSAYDAGGFIVDPVSNAQSLASIQQGASVNRSLIYDTGVRKVDQDGNTISAVYIEKGIIEFTIPDEAPDTLYYISKTDPNVSGYMRIFDIEENTAIDVEKEIIGKKTYKTSAGWDLSNGMKVEFAGEVTPAKYASGEWYVEGVGDKIKLVRQEDLTLSGTFTDEIDVEFDAQGFDFYPFSKALGYPLQKDYIAINRGSTDGNLWSRYNRWFHRSVIEKSSNLSDNPSKLDQASRAKRPIIEFEAGIKLYNFGTTAKTDVDLIDTFTKDVFSTIEGSEGYNIDGRTLTNGMRVLFTADTDDLVKGRIYKVSFIEFKNKTQISLIAEEDSEPTTNENVFVKFGNTNGGKFYTFNGTSWIESQQKTKVNESPLFELFDKDGKSFGDTSKYESTNFVGNKIFTYKEGSGQNDEELGIPLAYRSIENTGDILFNFDLLQNNFTYQQGTTIFTELTRNGFVRKYSSIDKFEYLNGWKKAINLSYQPVIRQYIYDNTTDNFYIDVYDNNDFINSLWIKVYLNGEFKYQNVDYTIAQDVNGESFITFTDELKLDDVINIKTRSDYPKNSNGYYEIASNLTKNPLNEDISEFTLGQVNDHVSTIVESLPNFSGVFPGDSNIRDLGDIGIYGTKFVKHSGPINLSLYHLIDENANVVSAIKFARREYGKFKRQFLQTANTLGYEGPVKEHVDRILAEMNKDKTSSMPFYFSDMIPQGGAVKTSHIILDSDERYFALSQAFSMTTLSRKAVQVYQNGNQLIHGKDYTFNDEGFVDITSTKAVDDVIDVYEYDSTNASFAPPTPTKLGLYPAYRPTKYTDTSYQTPVTVIEGHDGSKVVGYDDFRDDLLLELEKRIYNNIKISYDTNMFDIHDFVPSAYRNTGFTKSQIDSSMTADFVQWTQLVDADFVTNDSFDRDNQFTFNYTGLAYNNSVKMPGYWRQVYKLAFDTDRPNMRPWEMLGFSIEPTWWTTVYGPAPYTSNNKLLWADLEQGIIREPNKDVIVSQKYIRTGLTNNIPVDDSGNLLSPNESNVCTNFSVSRIRDNWTVGDGGPVESAWRSSSEYPFSLISAWLVNQPNKVFGCAFDRNKQKRNLADQIIYGDNQSQIQLKDIDFPNTINDTAQTFTSGIVNYIGNYLASNTETIYNEYKSNLVSIQNQVGSKIAGYSDKDKFKLILDARTVTNQGNVFIPKENYDLFLNTSSPLMTLSYSGVIVEKQSDGYIIRGYDNVKPSFNYYKPIAQSNDTVINIGGISESFVDFTAEKTYSLGQIVKHQNAFYRVTNSHTSTTNFISDNFVLIPELPIKGGAVAEIRKIFERNTSKLNYGDKLSSIQEVVDFILGYGKYLESQGFIFDSLIEGSNEVSDWFTTSKQFLFWTTQNWGAGTIITLSPGAKTLQVQSSNSIVGNIFEGINGYTLLKADGKKLEDQFVRIEKGTDNLCKITVINTADGLYNIKIPLIQKEHVLLLDNSTVFGDIIYDRAPGYKQERIKVLGYRTDNWNGSLNIPGFVFDNAKPTEWKPYQDYAIGDLIKYKEFFYSADKKITGKELFDANDWNRLDSKPEPGLLTNFDYRINQFADFYDLDSDNFDTEQQRLAQHLIGYQKRQYLQNIINDDVSQYKFYQGFILDKGTRNSLTKLFDALASADKDSLEFYEEWAIKDGQYGAADGFEEVEYTLDETKFRLEPQPILLTDNITGQETDLIYRIREYETYLKSNDYDHSPLPAKYVNEGYTKNSGYVSPDDVDFTIGEYDDILQKQFDDIDNQAYLWIGNYKNTWGVFQHTTTDYQIESIETGSGEFTVVLTSTPLDINTGEILGIYDVLTQSYAPNNYDSTAELTQTSIPVKGFFKVKSVALNKIVFESEQTIDEVESCIGRISKFINVRVDDVKAANTLAEQEISQNEKLWIDNAVDNKWLVVENKNKFNVNQELSNNTTGSGHEFGKSIAVDDRNIIMAVGAPEKDDGRVYIYNRASNALNYNLQQVLEANTDIAASGQKFGDSVAMSNDGKYIIVGAPDATNVKTKFKDDYVQTTNYNAGDIVKRNGSLWAADIEIQGSVSAINFDTFDSVAQINYALNNYSESAEEIPILLTGDYPFTNIVTDHFLVRVPKDIYNGSGVNDQVFLRWNELSNANQTQIDLIERSPFDGAVPYITKDYLESAHTIDKKVDAILFIDASNVVPNVGDTVTTAGAQATVIYKHLEEAQLTLYVNNVNGELPRENSLFINGNDFVGEFELVGPAEEITTSDYYGGYWFIQSSNPYNVGTVNSDSGKSLVYKDIITVASGDDSTSSTNYYYQSLDYATTVQSSENVIPSYLQTLAFTGTPGPLGSNDPVTSSKFVVRVPKELSDTSSPGEEFNLYVNNLPDTISTIGFSDPISLAAGEIITQEDTGARAVVVDATTNSLTAKIKSVTGTFDAVADLTFSISGTLGISATTLPVVNFVADPSTIGLSFSVTNQTHTIDDIWDGYISYQNTKTLADQPLEPIVGQTVRDVTTGATAEVAFYQRNLNDVVIFVKNVTGTWSLGNQYGANAEIEMLAYAPGPDPDNYGRAGVYTTARVMGQIQRVSLGLDSAGIGKLFVVDSGTTITQSGDFRFESTLGIKRVNDSLSGDYIRSESDPNFEYWIYKSSTVAGIPRPANIPSPDNLDWTEVFKIETSASGNSAGLSKEGIYYIYEKNNAGLYISLGSYVSPDRAALARFGERVAIAKSPQGVYRGYINAPGSSTVSDPGKIYFIKNGVENNIRFNWEYAKNKKFRGEFEETSNYYVGDIVYLSNRLYSASTNITAGVFNNLQWDSTDDLIDYVGYVPNDTGLQVQNDSSYTTENPFDSTQIRAGDSTVLDQGSLYDFATSFDTTTNGEVLVVTAKYGNDKPNLLVIYRILQGQYIRSQQIAAPNETEGFGERVSISVDGKLIAVSAPFDDSKKNNQGKVYIYKSVNGNYEFSQTLISPSNQTSEFFGNNIDFDGTRLIVNAKNGDNFEQTTFDKFSSPLEGYTLDPKSKENPSATIFDNKFTDFKTEYEAQGSVYVYEIIEDTLLYAQRLDYQNDRSPIYYFGKNILLKGNHVYVGLPTVSSNDSFTGTVVDFRIPDNTNIYEYLREPKDTVDITKVKRVLLYNTRTNKLIQYLDYLDPIQGKVAGPAEQNLTYKTYYDPAFYTVGNDKVTVIPNSSWGKQQVGELWWNLTNAKYINPYHSNVIYSTNNWNTLFEGNSIDVYEWVESDVLPSVWDAQTDVEESVEQGIDGRSLYGDAVYSTRQEFDSISGSTKTKYYFWVKGKRTLPDVEFRTLNSTDVANLISDPQGQNYRYVSFISPDSFALYNCSSLLEDKDVAISVQYWTIDNQNINIHNQYQIVTEGLSTSRPNRDIERKWFDSLVGFDQQGKQVPAPNLSVKQKYGILNSPRQSWFVNNAEALKQVIERTNDVLSRNLIVDDKDLSAIQRKDPAPSAVSRLYDTKVDTVADLEFIGVAKATQAEMELVVEDGVITRVLVTNAGRGYLVQPTYKINGTGTGAELEFTIDAVGKITNVEIVNGGTNYSDSDTITIRKFTALVEADETILGKWALYERDSVRRIWQRISSQAFDVTSFWDYKDWYATGFNQFTEIDYIIDNAYELSGLNDSLGSIVKINSIGSGGWLLLRKIDLQEDVDYTVNYETIGRENGTIQFKNNLYDTRTSSTGYDIISFDSLFFDSLPSTEVRIILESIRDDIFTEELAIEYNNLFFASLRYVFSEQNYVDWAFKTSFIKAKHNVGELREDITFNNDNLPSYEDYIEEVKPFKTKLREYLSAYEKIENTNSQVTDFDLPPSFSDETKNIQPQNVKVIGNEVIGIDDKLNTYPYKSWTDGLGFEVIGIDIADGGSGYTQAPILTLSGGGGSGAKAIAKLGANGKISSIEVINGGSGYITAPILTLSGSLSTTGNDAKLSVILGNGLPRGMTSVIKFDRISPDYFITNLSETETFIGSGSKYVFDLKWPISTKTTDLTVVVDNIELLKNEYSFANILDTTKSYNRYQGRIILNEPVEVNKTISITYKKALAMFTAQDRINFAYDPTTGQFAKDVAQLMDGVDYGGVQVKSFSFTEPSGWDTGPWFTSSYDTYDTTYEDEVFKLDGSTISITLAKPLEDGVLYNLYKNGVRLDDPDWVDDSSVFTNPNAIMRSIEGDGETTVVYLDELGVSTVADDEIIIRKSTSDGSFLPLEGTYDTLLEGGALNYGTATGINAEDINIDGDGFDTPTSSKGVDENLPGKVFDTVDIKVYERPTGGASKIHNRNYVGDGTQTAFSIGVKPITSDSLFVKIDNVLQDKETYTIDYTSQTVTFDSAPASASKINIVTLDYSGTNVLDIDEFVADGSTGDFLTSITYTENLSSLVTIDGQTVEHTLVKSNSTYASENKIVIRFAEPPTVDSVVNYAIFEGVIQNYSTVTIDEFTADGSTSVFELSKTPFTQEPHEWFTIVQVNDTILNAGYSQKYTLTDNREYQLKLWQVPTGELRASQLRIFLNGEEIEYVTDWDFTSAGQFNPALSADEQTGSSIILKQNVGVAGDTLRIYVVGQDDSTDAGGEYRYGYFDENNDFVVDKGSLYINSELSEGDTIKVYQFSNHDSQGIERQNFDVVERIILSPGANQNSQVFTLDGSTATVNLLPPLATGKQFSIFLNNVRIDDPFFGTPNQTNDNALLQTVTGTGQTEFNLSNVGITTTAGDIFEIREVDAAITPDAGTKDWYEVRQLRNGYINLQSPAVDDQYVWVMKNGSLLDPSVDYVITENKMRVKLTENVNENDILEVFHFANDVLKNKFGWRQFKDILNRDIYKRLDGSKNYMLAEPLEIKDKVINLVDASGLPDPVPGSKFPGVIFVEGERIEYFRKDGNALTQLRRSTLGTGARNSYPTGTEIYDQSITSSMPYKDEVITSTFTADGTSAVFDLDFVPNNVNEFEVFVAGRRLRKTTLQSYQLDTDLRTAYADSDEVINRDSPEGDITLPAEFSIQNSNELRLLETPGINQKVIVVRKQGRLWNDQGTALSNADTDISRFLRSTTVDLP